MNRAVVLPVVLVALLAGCAPTPESPVESTPPPVTEPTPTPPSIPTRETVVGPEPLLQVSCNEIATSQAIASVSKHGIELSDLALDPDDSVLFVDYSIRAMQGDTCHWTNGTNRNTEDGQSNPAHSSLTISYTPDSYDGWKKYDDIYGPHDASIPENCSIQRNKTFVYCGWSGIAGETTWVDIRFDGLGYFGSKGATAKKFMSLVDSVKEKIAAAPRGTTWQAPTDVLPLPTTCPGAVTTAAFEKAFGLKPSSVKFFDGPIGGTGIQFEAELETHWDPCRMTAGAFNTEYGIPVFTRHAGEWAWLEARDRLNEFDDAIELDIPGLAQGDSAWMRTDEGSASLDLLVGGNWILIPIWAETFTGTKVDERTALETIATEVVSTVYDS